MRCPMFIHSNYPRFKFFKTKFVLGIITFFTTWNYIIYCIPSFIINPINSIVYKIFSIWTIITCPCSIRRNCATIKTRFRTYIQNLVFGKREDVSSIFCSSLDSSKISIKSILISWKGKSSNFFFSSKTPTTFFPSFSKGVSIYYNYISTITPTNPSSLIPSSFIGFSYNSKPVIFFTLFIYIISSHIVSPLKEYLRKLVLLSRQYLTSFGDDSRVYHQLGILCLDKKYYTTL